ncbi:DHH family phosphoesterase [Methanothermococcus okinawensis]|uniref:Phosphoesterase RecJ domain protein n=1 Tax=Methanothermococcus okinawensis (strain DSM 14208 / JCM 11175 / IH1) TaxID=647113 RepID=F8ANW4_METOI|nr:DHH family phosphoesterase [Methanothermococcus okinawensis]AEH07105.1 phosphoesterase RecJ domain protein [Methanothermococcus okinawensis IH1]
MITNIFKDKESIQRYRSILKKITERIKNHNGLIRVITHHDTDGLTSGALIIKMLYRLNKEFHLSIVEYLSKEFVDKLGEEYNNRYNNNDNNNNNNEDNILYIFCDMGSSRINDILNQGLNAIILDHHPPVINDLEVKEIYQLNAHILGINGAKEISASGVCYLVAREFGFYDLSALAITGAIGDMQHKPFSGMNKYIINEAREHRYLTGILKDIIYNCYDLPVWKSMLYNTQPYIRELNNKEKIINFLKKLNIDPEKRNLNEEDRQKLKIALMPYVEKEEDIIVDRYVIKHKVDDAFYLSELLNACGRKGLGSVGIGAAVEDDECINIAKDIYIEYKEEIIQEIRNTQINSLNNIEYFFGKKGMVGIIASLFVKDKPVLGIYEEGEYYKISSRGNKNLVNEGLNLSEAMKIAYKFGGNGGGHNVASGARVPKIHLDEFLKEVDEIVGKQLKK